MADNVHITRINDVWANALSDLDDHQTAILTDQSEEHVHREGSYYYFPAYSKRWEGAAFAYLDAEFNDITAQGDLYLAEYDYHTGDTDTRRRRQTDQITDVVGGVTILDMVEGAEDYAQFLTNVLRVSNFIDGALAGVAIGVSAQISEGDRFHVYRDTGVCVARVKSEDNAATLALDADVSNTGSGAEKDATVLFRSENSSVARLYLDGSESLITIDDDGSSAYVTIDPATGNTDIGGTLSLTKGSQDYLFTHRGNSLTLQGQSADTGATVDVFPYGPSGDADQTDDAQLIIWSSGAPSDVASEDYLIVGWDASEAYFRIQSSYSGTGYGDDSEGEPIIVFVGTNENQLHLAADGSVGIGVAPTLGRLEVESASGTQLALTADADGEDGVIVESYHDSASPADSDNILTIRAYGNNGGAAKKSFGELAFEAGDVSAGSESSFFSILTYSAAVGQNLFAVGDYNIDGRSGVKIAEGHLEFGSALAIGDGGASGSPTTQAATQVHYTVDPTTGGTDVYYQLTTPINGQMVYVANIHASNEANLDGVGGWTVVYPDEVAHGFYNSSIGDWVWTVLD